MTVGVFNGRGWLLAIRVGLALIYALIFLAAGYAIGL